MNIDSLIRLTQTVIPFVLAGFATVVILKERSQRQKEDTSEIKKDVKEFVTEFRNCISMLTATSERQAILQKVTNDTLFSLVNKLEHLEDRVNESATKIAILEVKGSNNATN